MTVGGSPDGNDNGDVRCRLEGGGPRAERPRARFNCNDSRWDSSTANANGPHTFGPMRALTGCSALHAVPS
jgi:hypothetical protein